MRCPGADVLPTPPHPAPPLTRATSCRAGGIPGSPAPGIPTLHHLPGLWTGPVGREAQGEEPGPGEGEAWGPRWGRPSRPSPARLTVPSLQLEPWLCRMYLEGAQREGASSLDSGSLDLCLSSFNSLFEDLEHFLMEVEQAA